MEVLEKHEVNGRLIVLGEIDLFGGSWIVGVTEPGDNITINDLAGKRTYGKEYWTMDDVQKTIDDYKSILKANPHYIFG